MTANHKPSHPLKYHGGKSYLAKRIIDLMPPHVHYVEPYFGGGAVLFAKDPEGVSEVVNDINAELTNFWRVLSIPDCFDMFVRRVSAIPFSQVMFAVSQLAKHINYRGDGTPDENSVNAAVGFFVRYRQSRQGLGRDFATLSRNRTRRGMNEQVSSWLSAVEGLPEAHERLKRVVILNADALDVIRQQDGKNTLFYCDPPYLHSTRNPSATDAYEHEMTAEQHMELLDVLSYVNGTFQLSGYHSELYDGHATSHGWRCVEFDLPNNASGSKTKERKTECLWMNY